MTARTGAVKTGHGTSSDQIVRGRGFARGSRKLDRSSRGYAAGIGAIHQSVSCHPHAAQADQELLDGGSLYWVIKGNVQARQKLVGIEPFTDNEGIGRCRLVLDPVLVHTRWQPKRPFQGWRYLKDDDKPADLGDDEGMEDLPPELRGELASLGLL